MIVLIIKCCLILAFALYKILLYRNTPENTQNVDRLVGYQGALTYLR